MFVLKSNRHFSLISRFIKAEILEKKPVLLHAFVRCWSTTSLSLYSWYKKRKYMLKNSFTLLDLLTTYLRETLHSAISKDVLDARLFKVWLKLDQKLRHTRYFLVQKPCQNYERVSCISYVKCIESLTAFTGLPIQVRWIFFKLLITGVNGQVSTKDEQYDEIHFEMSYARVT